MADEKKKRRGRRAYLEDFHRNVAGEYIYTGQTHAWKAPRGKTLRKLWLCADRRPLARRWPPDAFRTAGMERRVWALIPVCAHAYLLRRAGMAFVQADRWGRPGAGTMSGKPASPALPAAGIVTGILAFTSIVTEIANIFAPNFAGTLPFALGLIGLDVLAGATSVVLSRTVKGLEWA